MRLSHLSALAVMVALVGAMFVALQSVSAVSLLTCNTDGPTIMGVGDTCTFTPNTGNTSYGPDVAVGDPESSNEDVATVDTGTITAEAVGTATISQDAVADDPATTTGADADESRDAISLVVQVRKIAVTKIEFGSVVDLNTPATPEEAADDTFVADTDGTFTAGTDVKVRVTVSYAEGDTVSVTLSAPSTGLSLVTGDGATTETTQRQTIATAVTREANKVTLLAPIAGLFTLVTDGAPDGQYTVTATANDGTTTSSKATEDLTIGDAGNAVASASLSLGLREGYDTPADATDDKSETGSDSETGEVNLLLTITNGIGNPVNASDVDEIRIVAPFGDVSYLAGSAFTAVADNTIPGSALTKGAVIVQVASKNDVARAIDVYAIALGSVAGVATTDSVSLTFTGAADAMTIADATKTLRNVNVETDDDGDLVDDTITLLVSATDKGGNAAAPPLGLGITITGPDGVAVPSENISASQPAQGKDGKWRITVTNESGDSAATALKTGEYTLKAKTGSIEATATFTVAGAATSVSVSVDDMAPTAYGTIMATAMVTDKDGAIAADGTSVQFTSSDDKILKEVGDTAAKDTKDGSASQQFAVVGPGVALIIANVGDVSDVAVVESTAGSTDDAMPQEEASVACLSNLNGFATWSCGVESSASEIFGLVSGRGATAIHLWNGSAWVRY
ncbi:MAG: hypothetical protein OXC29_10325, partial [Rhodococcus sp.]|nr:hypothetical protein [Rhodococcus sp. (in: high G+C Gram-positive bacteria)]